MVCYAGGSAQIPSRSPYHIQGYPMTIPGDPVSDPERGGVAFTIAKLSQH